MKIITAKEAAEIIKDDWTIAISSFGTYAVPEELLKSVGDRFLEEGHPKQITTVTGITPGGYSAFVGYGIERLTKEGLLKRVIAAHIAASPELMELVSDNKIEAYTLPLGVLMELLRAYSAHRPGVVTTVGLNTFIDPRQEGLGLNAISKDLNIVRPITLDDEEYLFYKTFPINACLIRGTYADEQGNISLSREAVGDSAYEMAAAVHNNGGVVIVQVEDIVEAGTLSQKEVKIHHSLVDYVVKASDKELHRQGYADFYKPELTGEKRALDLSSEAMPLTDRKVITRRAAMELKPGAVINLGIGIPSGVGSIANEEGFSDKIFLSVECGLIGGVPTYGVEFGAAYNAEVEYDMAKMFAQYDGGILDMAFLGSGEIDREGNVNVSKFGKKCPGPGGFINISQNTKKVYFLGTFTTGGVKEEIKDGCLKIVNEGRTKKFVEKVEQISFSAEYAKRAGQEVYYITERAVFRLGNNGIELVEIAPGVDLERDILNQMEFEPNVAADLKLMDSRLFAEGVMNI